MFDEIINLFNETKRGHITRDELHSLINIQKEIEGLTLMLPIDIEFEDEEFETVRHNLEYGTMLFLDKLNDFVEYAQLNNK